MSRSLILLVGALLWQGAPTLAQNTIVQDSIKEGWNAYFALGLDLGQLFQLNPKQGAGQNRFGFGGGMFIDAIYKKNRLLWENGMSWQFGAQKLGAGVIVLPFVEENEKVPFQKTIDDLRLGSKLGYALSPDSKWFLSGAFTFQSLVASSYPGPETYPGNFFRNFADTITNAKFLAPATVTLSAGLEFKPDDHFSLYFSPLGAKWIIVIDDDIAALGIHGNPVSGTPVNGIYPEFENVDSQLGALLRAAYLNKFVNDRLFFRSSLVLYSNYLRNPQNIDVDWVNELGFEIIKGLNLSLLLNVFYDDDVRVQITDFDAPNGVNGLGKRVSITQQLLVKYNFSL